MSLDGYKKAFIAHQHTDWRDFYVNCDAVQAALKSSDGTGSNPAVVLREQTERALSFVSGMTKELVASTIALQHEMDTVREAEHTAHVPEGTFRDHRAIVKTRAWRAWVGAEQLANFADMNSEAIARMASHADRARSADIGRELSEATAEPSTRLKDTSAVLGPVKVRLRNFVATEFYSGDKKAAIEYLCRIERRAAKPKNVFLAGLTSGVAICFLVNVIVKLRYHEMQWSPHLLLYSYRPACCIALAVLLWAVNVQVFEMYGVNHVFILQTSAHHYLQPPKLMWFGCVWALLLMSAFWAQAFWEKQSDINQLWLEMPPVVVWVVVICIFLWPGQQFHSTTRHMLQRTLGRVLCAGFFPVIFRDVLLGDILTSMVKPMSDLGHLGCFFYFEMEGLHFANQDGEQVNVTSYQLQQTDGCGCLEGTGWSLTTGGCKSSLAERWGQDAEESACAILILEDPNVTSIDADDAEERCTQYNPWWDTVVTLLPFTLRLLQCMRRHVDAVRPGQGFFASPAQLYNACKYLSCILVTALSWADHMYTDRHSVPEGYASWSDVAITDWNHRPYQTLWLGAAVFSTVFKLYWDVVHDFGFSIRFWTLRPRLLFPRPVYIVILTANILLRMSWAVSISPGFFGVDNLGRQAGLWMSSFTAGGEVVRRFLWTMLRIESEHAKSYRTPQLEDDESDTQPQLSQDCPRLRKQLAPERTGDHSDEALHAIPRMFNCVSRAGLGPGHEDSVFNAAHSWGQIRQRVNVARLVASHGSHSDGKDLDVALMGALQLQKIERVGKSHSEASSTARVIHNPIHEAED